MVNIRYKDEQDRKCNKVFKTSEYERHKNRNPDRVKGICQWLLSDPKYQSWVKSSHDNLLWISADPGCGKSVLTESLIEKDLKRDGSVSICFSSSRTTTSRIAYRLLFMRYCVNFSTNNPVFYTMQFLDGKKMERSCRKRQRNFGEFPCRLQPIPLLVIFSVYWMPLMNARMMDNEN